MDSGKEIVKRANDTKKTLRRNAWDETDSRNETKRTKMEI